MVVDQVDSPDLVAAMVAFDHSYGHHSLNETFPYQDMDPCVALESEIALVLACPTLVLDHDNHSHHKDRVVVAVSQHHADTDHLAIHSDPLVVDHNPSSVEAYVNHIDLEYAVVDLHSFALADHTNMAAVVGHQRPDLHARTHETNCEKLRCI